MQSTQILKHWRVARRARRRAAGRAGGRRRARGFAPAATRARTRSPSPSAAQITSAISRISSSPRPRVVSAGVPIRRPGGIERRALVEGDRVAVDGDPDLLEAHPRPPCLPSPFTVTSTSTRWTSVPPVSTSTPPATRPSAKARALAIVWRWRSRNSSLCGDPERHRLGGDDVHQRAALAAGEDRAVDVGLELLPAEDQAAAGAAEGLVDGGRDDVRVLDRVGVLARGDEAREVGHVDHQLGSDGIGDLAEGGEVELAGIGRPAGDDQLRPVLLGEPRDLVHVDQQALAVDVVGDRVVELAREVELHPVRQVPAVVEGEAEEGVARLHQRGVDGVVRLRSGVRLDVGVLGAEQLLGPLDRQLLGDVDLLAAAVVALARVALGVLVGQHRAGRVEDRLGDEVLGGDHLERALLAGELAVEHLGDLGVDLAQRRGLEVLGQFGHRGCSSLHRGDLLDPARVTAALEVRREEAVDDRRGLVGAEALAGKGQHVGVVVAAAHLGLVGVVCVDRAHPFDLVRHDRDSRRPSRRRSPPDRRPRRRPAARRRRRTPDSRPTPRSRCRRRRARGPRPPGRAPRRSSARIRRGPIRSRCAPAPP